MSTAQNNPHRPGLPIDTGEFFLAGARTSVLLIHGLSGTPFEMRFLGERLNASGARVYGVRLAGHAGTFEELGAASCEQWYASALKSFERLRQCGEPVVVAGLSMGAVLAARLAADRGLEIAGIVMLAPAFFLPLWVRAPLKALRTLGPLTDRIYLRGRGSDIRDDDARAIHPSARLMPLSSVLELLKLSAAVRPRLGQITQPVLIIHGRHDHTCPMRRNVNFLMKHLGSTQKRALILENSFHLITVDSEKERVASEVIAFVDRLSSASASTAVS